MAYKTVVNERSDEFNDLAYKTLVNVCGMMTSFESAQGILLLAAVSRFHRLVVAAMEWMTNAEQTANILRFSPLQLRGGGNLSGMLLDDMVSSFGLLSDGCQKIMNGSVISYVPGGIEMMLNSTMSFNGWWMRTNDVSSEFDPIRFRLDASMDGTDPFTILTFFSCARLPEWLLCVSSFALACLTGSCVYHFLRSPVLLDVCVSFFALVSLIGSCV